MADSLRPLFDALARRPRPEDAARLILNSVAGRRRAPGFTDAQRRRLEATATPPSRRWNFTPMPLGGFFTTGSGGPGGSGETSLPGDYARPVGAESLLATAREADAAGPFFAAAPPADPADPDALAAYLAAAEPEIGKTVGASDFRTDRVNRFERRDLGLGLTKKQYNRRWRLAKRLERKAATLRRVRSLSRLTRVSHGALAHRLSFADFAADPPAARFVCYHAARCALRSEFTAGSQERSFDEVGARLLETVGTVDPTGWWAAAHVFPDPRVLSRLPADRLAALLALFREELLSAAAVLRTLWAENDFARRTMIVKRGDDSTSWNAAAGAFNRVRAGWFGALSALGLEEVIDAECPGKALRLMAADVAWWHRREGGDLSPDTAVWADLPLPWRVLDGSANCPRAEVERTCGAAGLDPRRSGWTAGKPPTHPVPFRPTPELVHGVNVGSPDLARVLRAAGVFSGKQKQPNPATPRGSDG